MNHSTVCFRLALLPLSMMNLEKAITQVSTLAILSRIGLMTPHKFTLFPLPEIAQTQQKSSSHECICQRSVLSAFLFSVFLSWSEQQIFWWEVAPWLWNRIARKSPLYAQTRCCCWNTPRLYKLGQPDLMLEFCCTAKLCLVTRSLCWGCIHSLLFTM